VWRNFVQKERNKIRRENRREIIHGIDNYVEKLCAEGEK
jgi:hypothetical protein